MSSIITVASKDFDVVKSGREQAEQIVQIGQWVNIYGLPALEKMTNEKGEVDLSSGLIIIGKLLAGLSADALIDLYILIFGCSKTFANKHFDIATLVDGITMLYDQSPSIEKVITRFFGSVTSNDTKDESFTILEQPTDGQTTL